MDKMMQLNMYKHVLMEHSELPKLPGPLVYVCAGNGVFLWGRRAGLEALVPVAECAIRGLYPAEPFVRLDGARVNVDLVAAMLGIAREARNEDERPVEALFYLNYTGDDRLAWQLTIPEQLQSSVTVRPVVESLDHMAYAHMLMEVHSHPRMRSFYSGTDNREEQGFRLYGVLGLPSPGEEGQAPLAEIRMRVSVFGTYWEFPASWVLELPGDLVEYTPHASSGPQSVEEGEGDGWER
jgi:hypothetical protein